MDEPAHSLVGIRSRNSYAHAAAVGGIEVAGFLLLSVVHGERGS